MAITPIVSAVHCSACSSSIVLAYSDEEPAYKAAYCADPRCPNHKPERIQHIKGTWWVSFIKEH
jgi:hypothetical protein